MTWKTYGSESPGDIVAMDFESTYSDLISLRKLSAWDYINHPDTEIYLVSLWSEGFNWVGHPKDAPWDKLTGKTVVAHNMSFDLVCFERLRKDKVVPDSCQPLRFACTADCTAFFRSKRSLQSAAKNFFGTELSKQVREDAKGKTYEQLKGNPEWDALLEYALSDAEWCWKIAVEKFKDWPAVEQRQSELNRTASFAGLHADREGLEAAIAVLEEALFGYGRDIPWYPDEPALSPKAVRAQGRKDGIDVPASLAKSDEAGEAFFQKYGDEFPWVKAIRFFRSTNILLSKLKTMENSLRPDGTFAYTSTYFGAHSGRLTAGVKRETAADSVGGAFNLYNLPRGELLGVNLRNLIVPPKGHMFLIADYAQIEARVLLWMAGDTDTLALISKGMNLYEAAAVRILGLTPEEADGLKKRDPAMYQFVKAVVLGAGYGIGWRKFKLTAPLLTGGAYVPNDQESEQAIATYRSTNPKVVSLWHHHHAALMSSAINGDPTHVVPLPSGRKISYYEPKYVLLESTFTGKKQNELVAANILGEPPRRIWGSRIVENVAQSIARDILRDAWVALVDSGFDITFTVYDELVANVASADADTELPRMLDIMCHSSPWAEGLPLAAEGDIVDRYTK
jgi:hypothetical protein